MKYIPNIVGGLLGLVFIAASTTFFLGMVPKEPQFAAGSPGEHFMLAFGPTGYMHFVKACELIGGILCVIPRTRNIGLLFLGPIILNIAAFSIFVAKKDVPVAGVFCALAAYLLWAGRKNFCALLNRQPS